MLNDGVKVTIGNRELNLVLNTEAMAQLAERYGDIDGVADKLNDASYPEKIRMIPELIALLATQGEAIKGNEEPVTPQFVARYTMPCDVKPLMNAFMKAVAVGMNITIDENEEDTDIVLAEIQKNAQGAAGD